MLPNNYSLVVNSYPRFFSSPNLFEIITMVGVVVFIFYSNTVNFFSGSTSRSVSISKKCCRRSNNVGGRRLYLATLLAK